MKTSKDYDCLHFTCEGFENRFYPQWAIQYWSEMPLCTPEWSDADGKFYAGDRDLAYEVGGYDFRPVRSYPEDLKMILDRLREVYPDMKFRMVIRVEAQKEVEDA